MFAEKAVPRQLNLFVLLPCTLLSHLDDAVIHIQLTVFKRLAVVLVDETQTLERQVRVHIVDEVAVFRHHAAHAAGSDDSRLAAQLLLDIRDNAGQRAG